MEILLGVVIASTLLVYYTERRRVEQAAGTVLSLSGGYLLRRRGIPFQKGWQDAFLPVYQVVVLRKRTAEGRTVRDLALAAHEAAHALRFARQEQWALLAYRAAIVRWMLLGSGLTLAFLFNPASIAVLALAFGVGLVLIPEEEAANIEAMEILRQEGLKEQELAQAQGLLDHYQRSYWLMPMVALAVLGWQAVTWIRT
jgi:Zn-dependent membrane protease YugP